MTAHDLTANLLNIIKALLALLALVMGGLAMWKLTLAGFAVDAKTSAEIAACFAATFYFLK